MEIIKIVISAIGGIFISGIFQFIISERRIRSEYKQTKLIHENEKQKQEKKDAQEQYKIEILIKEKLLKIAYQLKYDFTLTSNYIFEVKNISDIEIHDHYLQQINHIIEAITNCLIYFPQITEYFRELSSIANLIWGKQQDYFSFSKDNEKNKNKLRLELIELFDKVPKIISNIENDLK